MKGITMKQHKAIFVENSNSRGLQGLQDLSPYGYASTLSLDYCGWEKCTPGHKFGPFIRKYYVLHLILKGKGRYQTEQGVFHLKMGDAFLIYPGKETVYQADANDPWEYTWVGFHGIRSEEFIANMGLSPDKPIVSTLQTDKMAACIQNMLDANQITVENELRRLGELMLLFSLFMEDKKKNQKEESNHSESDYSSDVYVAAAMEYMILHLKEKIKIDELAEMIGITRSYLTGSFKKKMGFTPQEYLIQMRMDKACSLLRQTTDSIQKIAKECGYEDSLTFSKAFRLKFGISPTVYRESEHKTEI